MGFMVVGVFFFVFDHLAIQFVGQHINGAVHVFTFAGRVQIVARHMQSGFYFLGKLFYTHGHFDINHVIKVIADAG